MDKDISLENHKWKLIQTREEGLKRCLSPFFHVFKSCREHEFNSV